MRRPRLGFTLVELLVALAITSMLIVLLASVVNATLSAWAQGRNRLDTFANARQLIGRIQDEISAAIAAKDRIEFVENSPALAGSTAPVSKTSENVFFVAPYANSGSGDLCVIAYRHDAATHKLERAFKNSDDAWAAAPASRYKVSAYAGNMTWKTVAEGVMEFEIASYSQADIDNNQAPADAWNSTATGGTTMEGKTPRRIVLRLKVVDDRTLVRLAGMTANSPAYNATVTTAARDFSGEFTLPAR